MNLIFISSIRLMTTRVRNRKDADTELHTRDIILLQQKEMKRESKEQGQGYFTAKSQYYSVFKGTWKIPVKSNNCKKKFSAISKPNKMVIVYQYKQWYVKSEHLIGLGSFGATVLCNYPSLFQTFIQKKNTQIKTCKCSLHLSKCTWGESAWTLS